MKAFMDVNVVLDVVLNRQPWVVESSGVWNAQQSGQFEGYISATEITNLDYVVRRLAGESTARSAIKVCLNAFRIIPVDHAILLTAEKLLGKDFEDDVCIACAAAVSADWIVTRDASGFTQSSVPANSRGDFLIQLSHGKTSP